MVKSANIMKFVQNLNINNSDSYLFSKSQDELFLTKDFQKILSNMSLVNGDIKNENEKPVLVTDDLMNIFVNVFGALKNNEDIKTIENQLSEIIPFLYFKFPDVFENLNLDINKDFVNALNLNDIKNVFNNIFDKLGLKDYKFSFDKPNDFDVTKLKNEFFNSLKKNEEIILVEIQDKQNNELEKLDSIKNFVQNTNNTYKLKHALKDLKLEDSKTLNVDEIDKNVQFNAISFENRLMNNDSNSTIKNIDDITKEEKISVFNQTLNAIEKNVKNNDGTENLTLKLKPAHLGELELKFIRVNQNVQVEIIAMSSTIKDTLLSSISNMNKSLQYLNISDISVKVMDKTDVSNQFSDNKNFLSNAFEQNSNQYYNDGSDKRSSSYKNNNLSSSNVYEDLSDIEEVNKNNLILNTALNVYI